MKTTSCKEEPFMSENRICQILNVEKPVIQGPMAWSSFAPLVAAVSNAGGFGVLGIAAAPAALIHDQIQKTRELTDKPFGVNVFMEEHIMEIATPALLEEKPAAVYADILNNLDPVLCGKYFPQFKEAGMKIIVKASTLQDAITAEKCGADIVVAKGWEGGGHVTPESTMTLLPQIVRKLSIPVVASGGIADGYGMAAAVALGADGFEMGSRFLCATENTIHENAKQAIVQAGDMQSVITSTSTFDPCRQLQNAYTDKMIDLERNYPISKVADQMRTLAKPALKTAMHDGDIENGGVMVGMIAPLINDIKPAGEIIDSCLAECRQVIENMSHFAF